MGTEISEEEHDPDDFVTPSEEKARKRALAKEKRREENRKKLELARKRGDSSVARQPIGTPVGNKQRMQEFKEKLLTAVNGENVIRKTLEIAMDDEHPGQMSALKLCMDRMLPTSLFDDVKKGTDKPMININITGIGENPLSIIEGDVVEDNNG